jgi:hypothetical protein
MDPTLVELLQRLDQVTSQCEELRADVHKAIVVAEVDPEMSLTRARKVLEFVIRRVWQRSIPDEEAGTRPLENLLQRLVKDGHLPRRVVPYANAVRELGNVGTHAFDERITKADVIQSLAQLMVVLEWYFEETPSEPPDREARGTESSQALAAGERAVRRSQSGIQLAVAPRRRPTVWLAVAVGAGLAVAAGAIAWWQPWREASSEVAGGTSDNGGDPPVPIGSSPPDQQVDAIGSASDDGDQDATAGTSIVPDTVPPGPQPRDSFAAVRAMRLVSEASRQHADGHADQALARLDEAIELDPSQAEAWVARGRVRMALGRFEEAADDLRQSLLLGPVDPALVERLLADAQRGAEAGGAAP